MKLKCARCGKLTKGYFSKRESDTRLYYCRLCGLLEWIKELIWT